MDRCKALKKYRASIDWRRDPAWTKTEALKLRVQRNSRDGLSPELFDAILNWKLRTQRGRQEQLRKTIAPSVVKTVTCCALSNVPGGNDAADKIRVRILTALPGVGVGVASAILALSDPYNYGVVDGAVWSALFGGTDKNSFTVNDYVRYLKRLRTYARELGWPAQEVDFFVWMHRQERTGT